MHTRYSLLIRVILLALPSTTSLLRAQPGDTVRPLFEPYRANYATWHPGDHQLKFQVGVQYHVADLITVAFSEKMFIDVAASSAPVIENDYRPEVFFDFRNVWGLSNVRVGYDHESNG